MLKPKKEIEAKIGNIITAIENGIYTETTKDRLESLEAAKRDIEYNIQLEKFKNEAPVESKESVIYYLEKFKNGDINNIDHQRQLINTFVDTIILDDEKDLGIIAFRYSDEANGTREFSIKNTLDMCSNVSCMVDYSQQYSNQKVIKIDFKNRVFFAAFRLKNAA